MNNNNLPNGFISVEDAVALINSDTRSDAKVDTQYLVGHIDWIQEKQNFRIPLMKTVEKNGMKTVEHMGSKNVFISTSYEKELLKKTIKEHYREMAGKEYITSNVRSVTSVADEETSGGSVRPRASKKSIAKEGAVIGEGSSITTNSADGAGV